MPEVDGMEAARRVRQKDGEVIIIFITNIAKYAIHGYEVNALDYILKPVEYYTFALKMQKAIRIINERCNTYVIISKSSDKLRVRADEIIYIEISDHDVCFHLTNGKKYSMSGSLKKIQKMLPEDLFVKCNNCYIVNLEHVQGIEMDMILIHGEKLKISRAKKKEFMQMLADYYRRGGR